MKNKCEDHSIFLNRIIYFLLYQFIVQFNIFYKKVLIIIKIIIYYNIQKLFLFQKLI